MTGCPFSLFQSETDFERELKWRLDSTVGVPLFRDYHIP